MQWKQGSRHSGASVSKCLLCSEFGKIEMELFVFTSLFSFLCWDPYASLAGGPSLRAALDQLRSEVLSWAKRIGVEHGEIRIRPMKRKWGSCSTARRLTFNEELLAQSAGHRKRIIVHELLHLKLPNHGKLFRALLKAYSGNRR